MYCSSEAVLLNDVFAATAVYANAVDAMLQIAGTGKKAAFQEKSLIAAGTLLNLRNARTRLYCHEREHCCKGNFTDYPKIDATIQSQS